MKNWAKNVYTFEINASSVHQEVSNENKIE